MGINWEQIVLMKRIHVRVTGVSLIHLPLFVVTRTPFTVKFLALWSFQHLVAFFGTYGFLRLQGSTGDEFNEFVLLMKMVSSSLLIGFLIAILCPLFTVITDNRYEKRKLEKRREKHKAIESLLNLKLDVEKEEEAKTAATVVRGTGRSGEAVGGADSEGKGRSSERAASTRSTDRYVCSARQSLAILDEIMRAQATKRASNYSMPLSGSSSRCRSEGIRQADEGERPESLGRLTKRSTELRKQTQSTDSGSHNHKKSKPATARTRTLRVT
ncbi:unnamed protein product [Schistocephalus solidus]|uniref:Uncharacterized protein n=1 Tax=Schistocephalus solidus TaxID=70667 RepID=A0A183T030_SCHSO|nr:unnamed protein product [Schistocephalus solidus]